MLSREKIKQMVGYVLQNIMKKFSWVMLVVVSLALPSLADTYYIDNPSLICKAHFKTSFGEFVTEDGSDFIFEFDEKQHKAKSRWGFKYNGLIEGTHSAMLLNWPKDSEKGILTVLAADYPCRASYFKKPTIQVAELNEAAGLSAGEDPLLDEISSMVDTAKNPTPAANLQPPQTQNPPLAGSQVEPEIGASVANPSPSSKSSNSTLTMAPSISVTGITANGPQGVVEGYVRDELEIAELQINGRPVAVNNEGHFLAKTFVPIGGTIVTLTAFNVAGMSTSMAVMLERSEKKQTEFFFEELNPLTRAVVTNDDAIAIIVGVGTYANTDADAIYADADAQVFQDYAVEKLGVPTDRVKTLVNDAADERGVLLAVMRWLTRTAKPGQSDVYIFFAGHGLASDDGKKMYLLPYDGAPELLDKTAILRDELFADIGAVNPRSVTVFLDTCYSNNTRPRHAECQSSHSYQSQRTSSPRGLHSHDSGSWRPNGQALEEAKHGMFSYFLMKGMEGDADGNQDNQITAGELHAYVQQNVIQQSSGSQTPELQGDADRVL